jgi:hypothetical protein
LIFACVSSPACVRACPCFLRGDGGRLDGHAACAAGFDSAVVTASAATAVSLIFTRVPLPGCGSGLFDGVRVKIEMDRRA